MGLGNFILCEAEKPWKGFKQWGNTKKSFLSYSTLEFFELKFYVFC